jgi:hypothetical protein
MVSLVAAGMGVALLPGQVRSSPLTLKPLMPGGLARGAEPLRLGLS